MESKDAIMLQLHVNYQSEFSRLQLLARLFFGPIYIMLPHVFLLLFVLIWAKLLWFYSTFYILLNGEYPKNVWDYQVGMMKWLSRVHLSAYNLVDGYPAFGIRRNDNYFELEVPANDSPDRLLVLLRFVFVGIMIFPHIFIWTFRNIWSGVLSFLAFFAVLFTGKYPENWFNFNIGTLRWIMRVLGYQLYLFDQYPPFTGKE